MPFINLFIVIAPWGTIVNGLTAGIKNEIKPVETLKFSSKNILGKIKIKHIILWLIYVLSGYLLSLIFGSFVPILGALFIGILFSKVQYNILDNVHGSDIEPDKRSIPNQGIRRSAFKVISRKEDTIIIVS